MAVKVAFACWGERLAPVFDTARELLIVEVVAGKVVGERRECLVEELPVQRALRLVELGVESLVCGAISKSMWLVVVSYGIEVVAFVGGDLRVVVQGWLAGDLGRDDFALPGCCGRRRFGGTCGARGFGCGRGSGGGYSSGGRRSRRRVGL